MLISTGVPNCLLPNRKTPLWWTRHDGVRCGIAHGSKIPRLQPTAKPPSNKASAPLFLMEIRSGTSVKSLSRSFATGYCFTYMLFSLYSIVFSLYYFEDDTSSSRFDGKSVRFETMSDSLNNWLVSLRTFEETNYDLCLWARQTFSFIYMYTYNTPRTWDW